MSLIRCGFISVLFSIAIAGVLNAQTPWSIENSGVSDSLMNVRAVNDRTVWAAGSGSCVVRTTDGGKTWVKHDTPLPGFVNVCVEPLDSATAWVVSIDAATGTDFRIFKTTDGGNGWTEVFRTEHTFGDAVRFFDAKHGIALGDPYPPDYFNVYTTSDGGSSWHRVPRSMIPAADSAGSEFGVTACLAVHGRAAWFATASQLDGFHPRVYHTTDMGMSWTASQRIAGLTGIAVSIDFVDGRNGVVVDNLGGKWAETEDGGKTWRVHDIGRLLWLRVIERIPGTRSLLVAGGEPDSGYVLIDSGGNDWRGVALPKGTERIRSASFVSPHAGWIVGGGGEILKWVGGDITRR